MRPQRFADKWFVHYCGSLINWMSYLGKGHIELCVCEAQISGNSSSHMAIFYRSVRFFAAKLVPFRIQCGKPMINRWQAPICFTAQCWHPGGWRPGDRQKPGTEEVGTSQRGQQTGRRKRHLRIFLLLVNVYITMENQNFEWILQPQMAIFNEWLWWKTLFFSFIRPLQVWNCADMHSQHLAINLKSKQKLGDWKKKLRMKWQIE